MWKSRTDRPLRRARNEISRHEDQQTRRKRSHQFTRWIQAEVGVSCLNLRLAQVTSAGVVCEVGSA
jgi:hypothetical protein